MCKVDYVDEVVLVIIAACACACNLATAKRSYEKEVEGFGGSLIKDFGGTVKDQGE